MNVNGITADDTTRLRLKLTDAHAELIQTRAEHDAEQDAAGNWRCVLCFSLYPCRILRLTTPTLDAIRAASAGLTAMFADMGAEDV